VLVEQTAERCGYGQTRWHTFVRRQPRAGSRVAQFRDATSGGDQIGIGPSARSRLSGTVYRNHSGVEPYLCRIEAGQSPVEETRVLTLEDRKARFVALSLGEGKPLDRSAYAREFGCSVEHDYPEVIGRVLAAGLISDDGEQIALSELGKLLYDRVTLAFYPQPARGWLAAREPMLQRRLNRQS
jgi:oxygen-independent coproporphyrinogen-3 oxidase